MEAKIYNQKGEEAGKIKLPEALFGAPWNSDLVHQVAVSLASNARAGTASVKGRGEVRGGGRKPWKQKGTGRARHGSTRSPIWVGGGVTHGPITEKNYKKKVNRKMKAKALFSILSKKFKDGEVLFMEAVSIPAPKTAEAKKIKNALSKIKGFEKLSRESGNQAIFAVPEKNQALHKSFRNLPSVISEEVRNLNPLEVLNYRYVIFADPENSIKILEAKNK